jgi:hypothetical protein
MTDQPFILTKKEPNKELTELELEGLFKVSGGLPKSGADTLSDDINGNPSWDD